MVHKETNGVEDGVSIARVSDSIFAFMYEPDERTLIICVGDTVESRDGRRYSIQTFEKCKLLGRITIVAAVKEIVRPTLTDGWEYVDDVKSSKYSDIYWVRSNHDNDRVVTEKDLLPWEFGLYGELRWLVKRTEPKRPTLPEWLEYVSNTKQSIPAVGPVVYVGRRDETETHINASDLLYVNEGKPIKTDDVCDLGRWLVKPRLKLSYDDLKDVLKSTSDETIMLMALELLMRPEGQPLPEYVPKEYRTDECV